MNYYAIFLQSGKFSLRSFKKYFPILNIFFRIELYLRRLYDPIISIIFIKYLFYISALLEYDLITIVLNNKRIRTPTFQGKILTGNIFLQMRLT